MHMPTQNDIWFSAVFVFIHYVPLKGQTHAFPLPSDLYFILTLSLPSIQGSVASSPDLWDNGLVLLPQGSDATVKVLSSVTFLNDIFAVFPQYFLCTLHLLSFVKPCGSSSNNQLRLFVLLPRVKFDWSRTRSECPMTIFRFQQN